jgi:hypothetical protein
MKFVVVPPKCQCRVCHQEYIAGDFLDIIGEEDNGVAIVPVVKCPLCGDRTRIVIAPRPEGGGKGAGNEG